MITILPATSNDLETLCQLAINIFSDTFESNNTTENLNAYLASHFTPDQLFTEWSNPNSLFYIAFDNQKMIGFIKCNFATAQTEPNDNLGMELQRIYVLKSYHGQQVAQRLMDQTVAVAIQHKAQYIWLGVWEFNTKAIRFYEKNGFKIFDKHPFTMGNEVQTDYLMRKELV
ncbi:GNAT family N-acetyltransferase [Flavobacterium branchiophilum]|uniref:Probable acetyltransferase, GNAT family n=1 Tax=Flavobacterium branchiophilum (strain FL-15) TaxID=1034807 RepID=G2Z0A8_FLABF|nr:GNAT family N-acetyltransferase [Flavobacterium branchiophilum]CCB70856.1 Probable acetyltransferase, GNAT family [Flavobacterium branchiophilum FL-15]